MQVAAAQADVRVQEAQLRAAAVQQQSDYFVVGVGGLLGLQRVGKNLQQQFVQVQTCRKQKQVTAL
jgi:hypothetical protein